MSEPLHPVRWVPPAAPALRGVYAPNRALDVVERFAIPDGHGPEDVVLDADGQLYTGVDDGRILRLRPGAGRPPSVVSHTYGRPLGLELDAEGRLIVCDADRGLLRVDPEDGTVEVLVSEHQGQALRHCDNAAVARDGTIYFSDSTVRFGFDEWRRAIWSHRADGRLYAHDPVSGETRLLLEDLVFANGVALSRDESFLVVAETGAYRLTRYWLAGPRAGTREVLIDNLPGFPDNVTTNGRGVFWVALPSPRQRRVDALLPWPRVRELIDRLPDRFQPEPVRYGFVLGIDEDGEVVHNLQGPSATYSVITGVREHDGWLYLGSLDERAVARVRAPAGP